jgi:hypothetical protein
MQPDWNLSDHVVLNENVPAILDLKIRPRRCLMECNTRRAMRWIDLFLIAAGWADWLNSNIDALPFRAPSVRSLA